MAVEGFGLFNVFLCRGGVVSGLGFGQNSSSSVGFKPLGCSASGQFMILATSLSSSPDIDSGTLPRSFSGKNQQRFDPTKPEGKNNHQHKLKEVTSVR